MNLCLWSIFLLRVERDCKGDILRILSVAELEITLRVTVTTLTHMLSKIIIIIRVKLSINIIVTQI